jgi:hypothetical protein
MHDAEIIGEVIEASTTELVAESRELHSPPPFGSFIKVPLAGGEDQIRPVPTAGASTVEDDPFEDAFRRGAGGFGRGYRSIVEGEATEPGTPSLPPAIYAVVYQATTSPSDSGRRPRAYWKDEEQLGEEQPELSEWLLVTNFRAIIVGYSADGLIRQFLPPRPPKLHSHAQPCADDEIRQVTAKMDFLRTLANFRNAPTEEVIAACIREANAARGGDFDFLVEAGKELASLMKDDYDRLQAIMRRVVP